MKFTVGGRATADGRRKRTLLKAIPSDQRDVRPVMSRRNEQSRSRRRALAALVLTTCGVGAALMVSASAPAGSEQAGVARTASGAVLEVGSIVGVAQLNSDGLCVVAEPISVSVEVVGDVAPEVVWEFNDACHAVVTEINWPAGASNTEAPLGGIAETEQ